MVGYNRENKEAGEPLLFSNPNWDISITNLLPVIRYDGFPKECLNVNTNAQGTIVFLTKLYYILHYHKPFKTSIV